VDRATYSPSSQVLLDGREDLESPGRTVAAGLEDRITTRIGGFVASPHFQERLPGLARAAHQGTVALLSGDLDRIPNVSIANGEVTLNVIPINGEVGDLPDPAPHCYSASTRCRDGPLLAEAIQGWVEGQTNTPSSTPSAKKLAASSLVTCSPGCVRVP